MSSTIQSYRSTFSNLTAQKRLQIAVISSLVFHFFGTIGMAFWSLEWFLQFTPLVLIISTFFLFYNITNLQKQLWWAFGLVVLLGLSAETIGVQTGYLFGTYHYGDSLGPKVFGVPLTIGMNWAALCLGAAFVINTTQLPFLLKAFIGGALPVFIDLFMEPLCSLLDFWHWQNDIVPFSNYSTWYVCSVLFVGLFCWVIKDMRNAFAPYFLLIQLLFFVALNILL